METTTVTRNGQITLPKDIREKLHIKEGDTIVMNIERNSVTLTKRDSSVFDNFESFLSEDFEKDMKKWRTDHTKRLKRLGIIK